MALSTLVDRSVRDAVLVFGSPPPGGRDLDLLVRPAEERALAGALAEAGLARRGGEWVRFADCTAEAVELVPAADWGLPAGELEDLLNRARALAGFEHLVEPAPDHQLLILARRVVGRPPRLGAGRRARVQRAVAEDPHAWERARARAAAWGAEEDLRRLREALAGRRTPGEALAAGPRRVRRRLTPRVVALSGIDGSGKSTQARALAATLERLGHPTAVQWAPLAGEAWLDRVARPVKRAAALVPALRPSAQAVSAPAGGLVPNPGRVLRGRSGVVSFGWSTLVALANGWTLGRAVVRHTLAGRVVVCDRYHLDSVVRMRFYYGPEASYAMQRRLIRLLSPPPRWAFFLDVDPATALARKEDAWSLEELGRQASYYREEHVRLRARRLDGEHDAERLCARIAEEVWRGLG